MHWCNEIQQQTFACTHKYMQNTCPRMGLQVVEGLNMFHGGCWQVGQPIFF